MPRIECQNHTLTFRMPCRTPFLKTVPHILSDFSNHDRVLLLGSRSRPQQVPVSRWRWTTLQLTLREGGRESKNAYRDYSLVPVPVLCCVFLEAEGLNACDVCLCSLLGFSRDWTRADTLGSIRYTTVAERSSNPFLLNN